MPLELCFASRSHTPRSWASLAGRKCRTCRAAPASRSLDTDVVALLHKACVHSRVAITCLVRAAWAAGRPQWDRLHPGCERPGLARPGSPSGREAWPRFLLCDAQSHPDSLPEHRPRSRHLPCTAHGCTVVAIQGVALVLMSHIARNGHGRGPQQRGVPPVSTHLAARRASFCAFLRA